MTAKEEFIEIYKANITREGSDKLLEWLQSSDFFTAPASTKFHSSIDGGLVLHSVNTYKRFIKLLKSEYGDEWEKIVDLESATIIALLHDVCKVNYYSVEYRNQKVEGEWIKVPYYTVKDTLPYGHGEKSVYIIGGFMKLNRQEAMAINWHMGGFDQRVIGGSYAVSEAFYQYPVSLIFHIADVQATYLDETK